MYLHCPCHHSRYSQWHTSPRWDRTGSHRRCSQDYTRICDGTRAHTKNTLHQCGNYHRHRNIPNHRSLAAHSFPYSGMYWYPRSIHSPLDNCNRPGNCSSDSLQLKEAHSVPLPRPHRDHKYVCSYSHRRRNHHGIRSVPHSSPHPAHNAKNTQTKLTIV